MFSLWRLRRVLSSILCPGYHKILRSEPLNHHDEGWDIASEAGNDECHPRTKLLSWSAILKIRYFSRFLTPSFLRSGCEDGPRRLHPTAYLDGLRGLTSLLVITHHASMLWFTEWIHMAWGIPGAPRYFIQLPIIRWIISGRCQIMVFFVISGFALAYKPVKLMRQRRMTEFCNTMASAFFRRHSRLFLPIFTVGLISVILIYYSGPSVKSTYNMGAVRPRLDKPFSWDPDKHLMDWVMDWLSKTRGLMNPVSATYEQERFKDYDLNLWTIPQEFVGSVLEFGVLVACCNLRPRVMMVIVVLLSAYSLTYEHHWEFCFLAGVVLADIHIYYEGTAATPSKSVGDQEAQLASRQQEQPATRHDKDACGEAIPLNSVSISTGSSFAFRDTVASTTTPSPPVPGPTQRMTCLRGGLSVAAFFFFLFYLGMPEGQWHVHEASGFRTIIALTPSQYHDHPHDFWLPLAAVGFIFTIDRTPFLQAIFTTSLLQYLGRISFMFYVTHGNMLWYMGNFFARIATDVLQPATPWQYCFAIGVAFLVWLVIEIWVADLTTIYVDEPSVKLTHQLYAKLQVKSDTENLVRKKALV